MSNDTKKVGLISLMVNKRKDSESYFTLNLQNLIDLERHKVRRQVSGLTAGALILSLGVEWAAAWLQSRLCDTVDIRP